MTMKYLSIEHLSKTFGSGAKAAHVLSDINLTIGQFHQRLFPAANVR